MTRKHLSYVAFCFVGLAQVAALLAASSTVASETEKFETVLGPTPITDATKFKIVGKGEAIAILDGRTLKISADFSAISSPATDAHLMLGAGIGIPGPVMSDLSVTPAASGTLAGTVQLTRDQIEALHAGRIYIQINSQGAPAPAGNLWGWLLPEHVKVGADVPQEGQWFLPQGAGLKAHPQKAGPGNRNS